MSKSKLELDREAPKKDLDERPQFAFEMRFQAAAVQCNRMTVAKVEEK